MIPIMRRRGGEWEIYFMLDRSSTRYFMRLGCNYFKTSLFLWFLLIASSRDDDDDCHSFTRRAADSSYKYYIYRNLDYPANK